MPCDGWSEARGSPSSPSCRWASRLAATPPSSLSSTRCCCGRSRCGSRPGSSTSIRAGRTATPTRPIPCQISSTIASRRGSLLTSPATRRCSPASAAATGRGWCSARSSPATTSQRLASPLASAAPSSPRTTGPTRRVRWCCRTDTGGASSAANRQPSGARCGFVDRTSPSSACSTMRSLAWSRCSPRRFGFRCALRRRSSRLASTRASRRRRVRRGSIAAGSAGCSSRRVWPTRRRSNRHAPTSMSLRRACAPNIHRRTRTVASRCGRPPTRASIPRRTRCSPGSSPGRCSPSASCWLSPAPTSPACCSRARLRVSARLPSGSRSAPAAAVLCGSC